jgi:UDP-2,3-diacylglucosamine pyrophosphatase LpxH
LKKILHIFPRDKFTDPFIKFINENFDKNEHVFLILGNENSYKIKKQDNIIFIKKNLKSLQILMKYLYNSEKIILHGLFISQMNIILYLQPWLLKKSYWVIWGGDLYHYKFRKDDFNSDLYEFVRKKVIKKMGNIIPVASEYDYDLAKEWYGTKAKKYNAFYPNPIDYKFLDSLLKKEKLTNNKTIIQIGNSADPMNNHIEILDILSKYKEEDIEIIVPLSYGNQEWAKEVINEGKKIFGNKFKALVEFLPPEEYGKVLNSVDIAIFNHDRQQALGNILALLYLGKKVYIKNDITTWKSLNQKGLKLYNTHDLKNIDFNEIKNIKKSVIDKNREVIKKEYSEEKCIELWENIFES